MLEKLKRNVATIATAFALLVAPMALAPVAAYAAPTTPTGGTNGTGSSTDNVGIGNGLDCGSNIDVNTDSSTCNNNVGSGSSNVSSLIKNIINVFSAIIGAISVIMIIVGGFQYITSGGDSGKITNARNTITYAIVGLVVVAMAQFLVQFVLNKVSTIGS